jgi:serine/threonine-protein kinase
MASPAPALHRVKLTVAPSDVSVEVEGRPADVKDGIVEIEGTLGSRRHVRLFKGKYEREVDVIVAEDGASPDRIELEIEKPATSEQPSAKGKSGPAATEKSGPVAAEKSSPAAPATVKSAAAASTAKPAAPPKTAAPGDPLIPDKFN